MKSNISAATSGSSNNNHVPSVPVAQQQATTLPPVSSSFHQLRGVGVSDEISFPGVQQQQQQGLRRTVEQAVVSGIAPKVLLQTAAKLSSQLQKGNCISHTLSGDCAGQLLLQRSTNSNNQQHGSGDPEAVVADNDILLLKVAGTNDDDDDDNDGDPKNKTNNPLVNDNDNSHSSTPQPSIPSLGAQNNNNSKINNFINRELGSGPASRQTGAPLEPNNTAFEDISLVPHDYNGRFKLIKKLGAGTFGQVFLCAFIPSLSNNNNPTTSQNNNNNKSISGSQAAAVGGKLPPGGSVVAAMVNSNNNNSTNNGANAFGETSVGMAAAMMALQNQSQIHQQQQQKPTTPTSSPRGAVPHPVSPLLAAVAAAGNSPKNRTNASNNNNEYSPLIQMSQCQMENFNANSNDDDAKNNSASSQKRTSRSQSRSMGRSSGAVSSQRSAVSPATAGLIDNPAGDVSALAATKPLVNINGVNYRREHIFVCKMEMLPDHVTNEENLLRQHSIRSFGQPLSSVVLPHLPRKGLVIDPNSGATFPDHEVEIPDSILQRMSGDGSSGRSPTAAGSSKRRRKYGIITPRYAIKSVSSSDEEALDEEEKLLSDASVNEGGRSIRVGQPGDYACRSGKKGSRSGRKSSPRRRPSSRKSSAKSSCSSSPNSHHPPTEVVKRTCSSEISNTTRISFFVGLTHAARMKREVHLLSNLAHPNIVSFIDCFRRDNTQYLFLEYVDGGDLEHAMARRRAMRQFLTEDSVLFLFVQVCLAIEYLHRNNVLHRDIKLANVILSQSWICKLSDFGSSEQFDTDTDQLVDGALRGTPTFLAPELFLGRQYSEKADMYSLGVLLYAILDPFGVPFTAPNIAALREKVLLSAPRPLSRPITPGLALVLRSLLRRDPTERPTALELLRNPVLQPALDKYRQRVFSLVNSSNATKVDHNWLAVLDDHLALIQGKRPPGALIEHRPTHHHRQSKVSVAIANANKMQQQSGTPTSAQNNNTNNNQNKNVTSASSFSRQTLKMDTSLYPGRNPNTGGGGNDFGSGGGMMVNINHHRVPSPSSQVSRREMERERLSEVRSRGASGQSHRAADESARMRASSMQRPGSRQSGAAGSKLEANENNE